RRGIEASVVVAELQVPRVRPCHAEADRIRVADPLASLAPRAAARHHVEPVDERVAGARIDLDDDGVDATVGRARPRDPLLSPAAGDTPQHDAEGDGRPPRHRDGTRWIRPSTAGAMVPAAVTACNSTSATSGPLSASTSILPSRNAVIPSPPL